jgi:drug/metabolite transporter (DMT)-like permease
VTSSKRVAIFALGAATVLPIVDAMVKWLVRDYSIVMVAWARFGLISIVLGGIGGAQFGAAILKPVARRLQILRGLAAVLGTVMAFLGFRALPLAECTAIIFLAPVLANLFSQYWLKERGDAFSWIAALASFGGVVAIARPGSALFTPAAAYPLIGAVGLAMFMALTRAVSAHDHPRITAFFGPFVSFIVFSLAMPFFWTTPQKWSDIAMFVAIGVLAAGAQILQTLSYRHGSTHQVAPFGYTSLVFAIVLGWAVFGAVPDAWAIAGMAVIAVAGLAMIFRRG